MLAQFALSLPSLLPNPGVDARLGSTPTAPNSGDAGLQSLKNAQVIAPEPSLLTDTATSSHLTNALPSLVKLGLQAATPQPPLLPGALENVVAQKANDSTALSQAPAAKVISAPKLHLQPMSREAVLSHLKQINGYEAKPNAGLIERASVWLKGVFKSQDLTNINKLLDRYENDQMLLATRKELAINDSITQGLKDAKTLSDLTTVMSQALNAPANSSNPFSTFASQFVLTPADDWQAKLTQMLVEYNPSLAALAGDTGVAELHASLASTLPATFGTVDNKQVLIFQGKAFTSDIKLGGGAFGTAYLYKSSSSDAQLVVKLPKQNNLREIAVEYNLHHALGATGPHPNLLGLRGMALQIDGRVCIITDVAKHGDLKNVLTQLGETTNITEMDKNFLVKKLMHDVMQGASRMHETGFVHYDIKPENILVDGRGRALLADFGTSKTVEQAVAENTKHVGTHKYVSPEVFNVTGYLNSEKSDVWSLGITAYEMLNTVVKKTPVEMALPSSLEGGQSAVLTASRGEAMPHNEDRLDLFKHDTTSLDAPAIANAQTPLEKLVNRMLATNPADRPSMAEVLADDVFKVLENVHNADPDPVQVEAQRLFGAVFNPSATQ